MDFFDTHIHLQDFDDANVINLLKEGQISKCICVSAKQTDWQKVADIYEKYPDTIVPAFGLHPWYVYEKTSDWAKQLETYLQKYPVSLIGECGFDRLKNVDYIKQKDAFITQINLANKYKKGLIIHAVKADVWLDDVWKLLPEKFVFHSFNSRIDLLNKITKHNGYLAVNMKILKNKQAKEIILKTDITKLLVETDAPYQTKITDLGTLIENLALIKNENVADLSKFVYANAKEFVKNG